MNTEGNQIPAMGISENTELNQSSNLEGGGKIGVFAEELLKNFREDSGAKKLASQFLDYAKIIDPKSVSNSELAMGLMKVNGDYANQIRVNVENFLRNPEIANSYSPSEIGQVRVAVGRTIESVFPAEKAGEQLGNPVTNNAESGKISKNDIQDPDKGGDFDKSINEVDAQNKKKLEKSKSDDERMNAKDAEHQKTHVIERNPGIGSLVHALLGRFVKPAPGRSAESYENYLERKNVEADQSFKDYTNSVNELTSLSPDATDEVKKSVGDKFKVAAASLLLATGAQKKAFEVGVDLGVLSRKDVEGKMEKCNAEVKEVHDEALNSERGRNDPFVKNLLNTTGNDLVEKMKQMMEALKQFIQNLKNRGKKNAPVPK